MVYEGKMKEGQIPFSDAHLLTEKELSVQVGYIDCIKIDNIDVRHSS